MKCRVREFSSIQRLLPFFPMRDGHEYKFWVYITASPTGTLNTGVTGFFERRIMQHKTGAFEGFRKK